MHWYSAPLMPGSPGNLTPQRQVRHQMENYFHVLNFCTEKPVHWKVPGGILEVDLLENSLRLKDSKKYAWTVNLNGVNFHRIPNG